MFDAADRLHPKCCPELAHACADVSGADNAQSLASQEVPDQFMLGPMTLAQRSVGFSKIACEGQHQGKS
jgi:hypothetical protein